MTLGEVGLLNVVTFGFVFPCCRGTARAYLARTCVTRMEVVSLRLAAVVAVPLSTGCAFLPYLFRSGGEVAVLGVLVVTGGIATAMKVSAYWSREANPIYRRLRRRKG